MSLKTLRNTTLGVGAFCIIALVVSFLISLQLPTPPCLLCNLQRGSYLCVGFFAFAFCFSKQKKLLVGALSIFLFLGFLISSYHLLVQFELVKDFCHSHNPLSYDQFENALINWNSREAFLGCKEKTWTLFKLPISLYNALSFLIGLIFYALQLPPLKNLRACCKLSLRQIKNS